MNDTPPDKEHRDLLKDYAHKELREMIENSVKFVCLAILLLWARDHTHNLICRAILEVAAAICVFPGAVLRMLCVLANPAISKQLIKEHPFWLIERFTRGMFTACFRLYASFSWEGFSSYCVCVPFNE